MKGGMEGGRKEARKGLKDLVGRQHALAAKRRTEGREGNGRRLLLLHEILYF